MSHKEKERVEGFGLRGKGCVRVVMLLVLISTILSMVGASVLRGF